MEDSYKFSVWEGKGVLTLLYVVWKYL